MAVNITNISGPISEAANTIYMDELSTAQLQAAEETRLAAENGIGSTLLITGKTATDGKYPLTIKLLGIVNGEKGWKKI